MTILERAIASEAATQREAVTAAGLSGVHSLTSLAAGGVDPVAELLAPEPRRMSADEIARQRAIVKRVRATMHQVRR
ncbi:MAG: hypothetical protein M3Z05_21085 [Gemmatimonadota bacterium]|nr:hypothetical protein [Gemmatimonadota bacterium]